MIHGNVCRPALPFDSMHGYHRELAPSDGSPYEKRVDAKGRVLSDKCIADEMPFEELPEGWAWARLETVALILNGDRGKNYPAKSKLRDSGIPFVSAINVERGVVSETNMLYMTEDQYDLLHAGKLEHGDMVFCIRGSLGKFGIFPFERGAIASSLVIVRLIGSIGISVKYLSALFDSALTTASIKRFNNGTAQPNLSAANFQSFLYPIPPLAEQRRIVERVGELMPLVEEYGGLEDAREALDAALPGRLRKSVLQLAVRGGLAPQDPTDEPAGVLLERIRGQRRQLVAEGKMKAPKGGESIIFAGSDGRRYEKRVDAKGRESELACIEDELPFEIPEGWEWARLESVLQLSSGLGYKKDSLTVKSERMVRVLRGGNIGEGDEPLVRDNDVLISAEFVDDSLLLRDGQIITPAVTSLENVGKAAIVRAADGNTVCGGFVFFLTPFLENPWHSEYLHKYLTSPTHIAFCKAVVKKSGQAFYNLSKSSLNSALIAIPPLAEQHRIANEVDRLFKILS